jgi:hypothetical protein
MYRLAIIFPVLLLTAGCAQRKLVPAPLANIAPELPAAAWAESKGVRMTVQPDHWKGDPQNLREALTPINVLMTNRSGQAVRIGYQEFSLATGNGLRLTALPPFRIEASVPQTATRFVNPAFLWDRFYLSPYYSGFYGPYFPAWDGGWAFDGPFYDTYTYTWQKPLPTGDMLEKALPEGVLENGGRLRGFLYFRRLPHGTRSVEFRAQLVNARSGRTFGSLDVPFVAQK